MRLVALLMGWGCASQAPASAPVPPRAPLLGGTLLGRALGPGHPTPVGFWGLNGFHSAAGMADVRQRFGIEIVQTATATPAWAVGTLLPAAHEAGVALTLRMTGPHRLYTRGGDFDLGLWKARLAAWQGSGVQDFVDDGTLVGHMLLDDIGAFPGGAPDAATIDAMAQYSGVVLPGLMTFVRKQATGLPVPRSGRYTHLDAAVHQLKASQGPTREVLEAELVRAEELGLGSICGLNIAAGGDGSSGQLGWGSKGWFAMSGAEIAERGAVLMADQRCQLVLLWEYDAEEVWADGTVGQGWLDRPAQRQAIVDLGRVQGAVGHPGDHSE